MTEDGSHGWSQPAAPPDGAGGHDVVDAGASTPDTVSDWTYGVEGEAAGASMTSR
jgi:hypothetical protein